MDLATLNFTAAEVKGKSCHGCLFADERASVCRQVEQLARLAQLPDCEYPTRPGWSVIYVARELDPRQLEMF